MPDLTDSFAQGIQGEQHFINYLAARKDGVHVCDVSGILSFQQQGIDIIFYRTMQPNKVIGDESELERLVQEKTRYEDVQDSHCRCYTFEIKSCSVIGRTGNFFLETVSNVERGTEGSFLYTRADYYVYYSTTEGLFHYLPMPKTRAWVLTQNFPEKVTFTSQEGVVLYHTKGLVVPRRELLNEKQLGIRVQSDPFDKVVKAPHFSTSVLTYSKGT